MEHSAATGPGSGPRAGSRKAPARQPGWALRLGQDKACDCVTVTPPRPLPVIAALSVARRRTVWDLGSGLHCSVIGTCLTTDGLRRLMRKVKPTKGESSDHRLHGLAVGLCAPQGVAARLINKALDDRHRAAIRRFEVAKDIAALRALWAEALAAGDIPGAYWAVLTHPLADQALIADAFGDVHMLSHLVGAANRADIRRLAEQDREIAALRTTIARQQQRLRDDITERDARIRALQEMLAAESRRRAASPAAATETDQLIAALQARCDRLAARAGAAEARRTTAEAGAAATARDAAARSAEIEALRREIAAAEAALDDTAPAPPATAAPRTILYVGGRSGQTAVLRRAAERCGATLLHHDAEQGAALLAGLVGRAALVVFPVDCVSHDAALAVKRLCRQAGRPFRPLRSTGAASLLAALQDAGAMTLATG